MFPEHSILIFVNKSKCISALQNYEVFFRRDSNFRYLFNVQGGRHVVGSVHVSSLGQMYGILFSLRPGSQLTAISKNVPWGRAANYLSTNESG
jgi:hypothetical protein